MALSKFILDISREIEVNSDAKINFSQETKRTIEKWIAVREISKKEAINLRTAEETKNGSVMILQQFNPSALLKNAGRIHCRIPGCSSTTQRLKPSRPSDKIKQDLFLCDTHRATLTRAISNRCGQEVVTTVNVGNLTHAHFEGYTYMIDQLENAFRNISEKSSFASATNSLLAEVLLNTRNFLIITNALLNPDEDNTRTVLAPYMSMFQSFLSNLEDSKLLQKLITALRDIMKMTLFFFGVLYSWVSLANPGARVGSGIGLLLGFVGSLAYMFSPARTLASSVVGLVAGNLIGGGGYDWYKDHHYMKMQQQLMQEYQEFLNELFGYTGGSHVPLIPTHCNEAGDLLVELPKRD